jgi:hypothetical protein
MRKQCLPLQTRIWDAAKFDERNDAMHLVTQVSSLGLALAAWSSLLSQANKNRVLFSVIV